MRKKLNDLLAVNEIKGSSQSELRKTADIFIPTQVLLQTGSNISLHSSIQQLLSKTCASELLLLDDLHRKFIQILLKLPCTVQVFWRRVH